MCPISAGFHAENDAAIRWVALDLLNDLCTLINIAKRAMIFFLPLLEL